MLQAIRAHRSVFNDQYIFHIRMSLNREAKCRKAESQQVKLENEEMGGPWEKLDPGASTVFHTPKSVIPALRSLRSSVGVLTAHQDTRGNIFYTVEGSELDQSLKRMSETFLLEHLPNWEMWTSKLLLSWTTCRRWGRIILKTFLKTIDRQNWKLDSYGLPVQLLPDKYPTWPKEIEHRAKIEPIPPCREAKKVTLSQKSAASGAARDQDQELRKTIETAKSDFLNQYAEVAAFATLSSEQIYEKLNVVTLVNHLKPLCKSWGLVQCGRKEEVIDRIIAYIIEQRGTASATITIPAKTEVVSKKLEQVPTSAGPPISAHYTQECQHPHCQLKRGIAKHEMIVKVRPYGWCHQECANMKVKT